MCSLWPYYDSSLTCNIIKINNPLIPNYNNNNNNNNNKTEAMSDSHKLSLIMSSSHSGRVTGPKCHPHSAAAAVAIPQ